jgi:NADH:ubiquinone oxidoreductase subunit H
MFEKITKKNTFSITINFLAIFIIAIFFIFNAWININPACSTNHEISLIGYNFGLSLIRIILVLVAVAYFTLGERKIMAAIQRRRGPNIVGVFGLLQPLADGLKLLCKEMIVPTKASSTVFLVAPLFIIILSLVG